MGKLLGKIPAAKEACEEMIKEIEQKTKELNEENRKKAIEGILALNKMYVLEKEDGSPLTAEYLKTAPLDELIEILEIYTEELKKDLGEIQ